jgi:hypothetical protein
MHAPELRLGCRKKKKRKSRKTKRPGIVVNRFRKRVMEIYLLRGCRLGYWLAGGLHFRSFSSRSSRVLHMRIRDRCWRRCLHSTNSKTLVHDPVSQWSLGVGQCVPESLQTCVPVSPHSSTLLDTPSTIRQLFPPPTMYLPPPSEKRPSTSIIVGSGLDSCCSDARGRSVFRFGGTIEVEDCVEWRGWWFGGTDGFLHFPASDVSC